MKKKNLELWAVKLLKSDLGVIEKLKIISSEPPWSVVNRALAAFKSEQDILNGKVKLKIKH